jgi:hypothetical protein
MRKDNNCKQPSTHKANKSNARKETNRRAKHFRRVEEARRKRVEKIAKLQRAS